MKRTAPKLKKLYNQLNRKWFRGRLPKDAVVYWGKNAKWAGDLGSADDSQWDLKRAGGKWIAVCTRPVEIMISSELKTFPRQVEATLLHEMVHADLFPVENYAGDHGEVFQNRMLQLARAGAFKRLW